MAPSRKLLTEGEDVLLDMRTHVKALLVPVIVLVLVFAIGGFLLAIVDPVWARWLVLAVGAVVLVWWVVAPFVRWMTQTYAITNRRVLEQHGVFTKTGRAMPLHRINDVKYEKNLIDRMLGCGSLLISDASEQGGMVLNDVPKVEDVHRTLTNLVFGLDDGADDDGTPGDLGSQQSR